jgi:predicted HTH transcriptional regulator
MNKPEQQRLTIEDINVLIRSRTEESLTLEYKAAGALALTGKRDFRDEISKDVSSMANSAGGRIIYGVSEDPTNSWLPGEFTPVQEAF